MITYSHTPVLLQEVMDILNPQPGQRFVDCTLGGGGYTMAILERTAPSGQVLAIDLDEDAIDAFRFKCQMSNVKGRIHLVHGNFRDVAKIAVKHGSGPVQGIVADLGLSSYELDSAGRGISFQKDEPLDMRFSAKGEGLTAAFILNEYTEKQLADIFENFGEEKFSKAIARNIVRNRDVRPFKRTGQLTEVIAASIPARLRHKAADSFRRAWQALRIAVNAELENLEKFLPEALGLLAPGGVLAVVSFHSLEDRQVKQFFTASARGCVCPKDFPTCVCGRTPAAKILTKKPVYASASEVSLNSRSRPAKLRAIQKL